jgi:hypothetical protein
LVRELATCAYQLIARLAAARLLRADLAVMQNDLAVLERDERHDAVAQVVVLNHLMQPLVSWPSTCSVVRE